MIFQIIYFYIENIYELLVKNKHYLLIDSAYFI